MDVADVRTGRNQVKDDVGDRTQKLFQDFLENCRDEKNELKYLDEAQNLIKPERNTLSVSFTDIQHFNQNLSTVITEEFYRVYPYLCRALRNFVKDHAGSTVPSKEYYVSLTDVPTRLKVRELTTFKVGTLVRISGQVVRTHPVHPELVSGTFTCLDCQTVIKDVEQQFKYTQPAICPNSMCLNRTRFLLEPNESKFVDFQKIRIQEVQAELPRGSIPRSLEVVVRAETVEQPQAGDRCDFTGTLIVVPDVGVFNLPGAQAESASRFKPAEKEDSEGLTGLKSLGARELHYRLAFLACSIVPTNAALGSGGEWHLEDTSPESLKKQMSEDEWKKLFEMSTDKHLYQNLVNSLFPTIHGNEEVKRGILLMLFGGVAKTTEEGTSLRGDINICIVGDPSAAKSQFLKQVSDFCPRALYTSGKASTAAGLTAAVVKDEESFDFVIEAGALMLADNGICCIDEFDKMDPKDQIAIHEAMEQQTISITKAGVKATLNARTSILAAANPIAGRYDRGRSLRQNINMGAPIMSRFDLFFILIDEANEVTDYSIARKIVDLHARGAQSVDRVYTPAEVLRYIMFARQFKPTLGKEAAHTLVKYYKLLRQRDTGGSSKTAWRITVRQLESLIRLSEAYARMRCCDVIQNYHVKEAFRLLNKSIIRVEQPDVNLDGEDDIEEESEDDMENEDDDEDIQPETMDSQEPRARPVDQDAILGSQSERIIEGMDINDHPPPPPKKKVKLSFEEYKSMSNTIIMYMRREEARLEEKAREEEQARKEDEAQQEEKAQMEEEGTDSDGLKRSQVVDWYLNDIADDIETEAELIEKKELVEKVIDRLIHHDHVIIPLSKHGLSSTEEDEDPVLVVHPNYVVQF